jgi:hypothetical protein
MRLSPMLQPLLSSFRRSQQKTLALIITAIAEVAQATLWALAAPLAADLRGGLMQVIGGQVQPGLTSVGYPFIVTRKIEIGHQYTGGELAWSFLI